MFATILKSRRHVWREWLISYLFLLPALSFFLLFVAYPMLKGVYISFFDYSLNNFDFIGLDNYKHLFQDKTFIQSMKNTILIVFIAVPLVIAFSIFVAMTIYKKNEFTRSFFRGVFYLPAVTSVVSITVVWASIYELNFGILNYITSLFGAEPIAWLGNPHTALFAIIAVLITTSVGQPIILYVASVGNIPTSYIEAAQIDRATSGQIFRKIIWPMLMPTNLYIIVITTINTFQTFAIVQLLTAGGPLYKTSTVMYGVYEKAFMLGNFGLASAMGIILAVVIGIISFIQFRYLGSDVEY
ncbi:carbohydrate ABC transporter permease [Paenibacillus macquariensis]|uniref:Multiple sugar transport system permease protein n=1 Tax=Paenibacillus macquariensis TaxID=948756 RepID=A0ABY1JY18_9BACL|nr:sugar ABC transporter permease [Paenibacillus macquariensis]MEC0089208.1 sugar ABC transporter permease [Paenibacillus macquariensis]OAB33376.1 acetylneuraminate ABC transporter permease [Paenibacillus macquariensis subsp. macquariensis]SIQ96415.1 multiple sugar transport system permease protein [Paenibacillus macquariensis]